MTALLVILDAALTLAGGATLSGLVRSRADARRARVDRRRERAARRDGGDVRARAGCRPQHRDGARRSAAHPARRNRIVTSQRRPADDMARVVGGVARPVGRAHAVVLDRGARRRERGGHRDLRPHGLHRSQRARGRVSHGVGGLVAASLDRGELRGRRQHPAHQPALQRHDAALPVPPGLPRRDVDDARARARDSRSPSRVESSSW